VSWFTVNLGRFRFIWPQHVRQRSPVSSSFAERGIIFVVLIPQQRTRSQ